MYKTFTSVSFGCRVNVAEKLRFNQELISRGFFYDEKNPSFFIINSCAVTRKAEREVRQLIYQTKRKSPNVKIIVTGCAATRWLKDGVKVKGVELLIDNNEKDYLVDILEKRFLRRHSEQPMRQAKNPVGSFAYAQDDKFLSSGRLLVKIQDGCQRFCSYCIVPYLRGLPRSRKISDIVSSIKKHEKYTAEVILTAINTESFGYDTNESFVDLLQAAINKTKVPRISLGSLHPWSMTDEFFRFYKKNLKKGRLVNFFHIPLQSGSNKILNFMKRGYTREGFIEKLHKFYKINPMVQIGTDIIVGFLGETDKDFQDTYNFLKSLPIAKFHIFRFSCRDKTAAWYMKKRLKEPSEIVKKKRAKTLSKLAEEKYRKFLLSHIGKTFSALFLNECKNGFQKALLSNQVPVFVKTSKNLRGKIKDVRMKRLENDNLFGKII